VEVFENILGLHINFAALELVEPLGHFLPFFEGLRRLAESPIFYEELQEMLFLLPNFLVAFSKPPYFGILFPSLEIGFQFPLIFDEHGLADLRFYFIFILFHSPLNKLLFDHVILVLYVLLLHISSVTSKILIVFPFNTRLFFLIFNTRCVKEFTEHVSFIGALFWSASFRNQYLLTWLVKNSEAIFLIILRHLGRSHYTGIFGTEIRFRCH
jgi:hypothetical protein